MAKWTGASWTLAWTTIFRAFAEVIDPAVYGQVSYEQYSNYQPGPDRSQTEVGFYGAVNQMCNYVFSTTLGAAPADATPIRADVAAAVYLLT